MKRSFQHRCLSATHTVHCVGYQHVVHEKRDFYCDMRNQTVPKHNFLITNPPYSAEHKIKCLDYTLQRLQQDDTKHDSFGSVSRPAVLFRRHSPAWNETDITLWNDWLPRLHARATKAITTEPVQNYHVPNYPTTYKTCSNLQIRF